MVHISTKSQTPSLHFQITKMFGGQARTTGYRVALLLGMFVVSFCFQQQTVEGFTTNSPSSYVAQKASALSMSFELPSFPNPFGGSADDTPADSVEDFETSNVLIAKAKAVLASDLGVQDPSLLSDDFIWIGPSLPKPLGKVEYLAAEKFFNLRQTFPDLDYRAHDFRVDESDPSTVRCTVRVTGTMLGILRLRGEIVPPNGQVLKSPPEAISLTFDEATGKLVKLVSGFSMDRCVGNTNGQCGVNGAAIVAGKEVSEFDYLPISSILSRFFARPLPQLDEAKTLLAPFPESVMIQLVKGILSTNLAADDPTLLSKDFVYYTPYEGPVGKKKFIQSISRQEFAGVDPEFRYFRVDPFDPYRVWVDVKLVGPGVEGPPQAYSFTFDDNGFCTRISAGAVMDPSIGMLRH